MHKWSNTNWNNEQGYALYLVVVVSFIIFMVLTQTLTYYVNQVQVVQMKEESLRAQLLLRSAVTLWLEHLDVEEMEQLKEDQPIQEMELDGGIVRFYKLASPNKAEWVIRISARPYQNDVRHRVELTIDKATRQIKKWTEKMSS